MDLPLIVVGCIAPSRSWVARPTRPRTGAPPHCALIQTGQLQAIVGDTSRDGKGGRQHCGLWSLTSKQRAFNAFGNPYAGLLPGELRAQYVKPEGREEKLAAMRAVMERAAKEL